MTAGAEIYSAICPIKSPTKDLKIRQSMTTKTAHQHKPHKKSEHLFLWWAITILISYGTILTLVFRCVEQ